MSQSEKVLVIADSITVGELAQTLNLPVTKLIGELFKNGFTVTINQRIDFEIAEIIVEELGLAVTLQRKAAEQHTVQHLHKPSSNAVPRPPIVAVMGHVDHGKTTLLDTILKMKTVAGEAGGITQHISAYQAQRSGRTMTLLDTPGHEAFAALRQHGAALTDVVVIVVAADDGVKPQTVEAIRFARDANAKIIVAINKIDKDTANPDMVKAQLASEHHLNPEEWGGDTIMVPISAKTGQNIDKLLDTILLVADMEELRADTDVPAEGLVIEAHMEKGRGSVVNLLIEQGRLAPGHFLVAGQAYGKVRTLLDYTGAAIKAATPATPVTVTGFKELPQFGDIFTVVKNEKEARLAVQKAKLDQARKNEPNKRETTQKNNALGDDGDGLNIPVIDTRKKVMIGGYKVDGYRVQAYAGGNSRDDKNRAQQIGNQIKAAFPDQPIYVHFYSPRWICRVGNYRSIEEATRMLNAIQALGYKQAVIVKGKITVQN